MFQVLSITNVPHNFSSTQIMLPKQLAESIIGWGQEHISDDEVYSVPGENYGREDEVHVTVKYGLHTKELSDVEPILSGFGEFDITLGEITAFQSDEYDVVKIDVESDRLHELNALISKELKCTDSHPKYIPHVTIAYVLKDVYKSLPDTNHFAGRIFTASKVVFSPFEGKKQTIRLNGESDD